MENYFFGISTYLNSVVLLSFIFGTVGISTYYYTCARGSNQTDSVNAAMMMIFLIIGFMLFYIGAYFVTNPDKQLTSDLSNTGWGLIGFGFSVIALSYSFLSNFESQRKIDMINILLVKGRKFTRNFHDKLNSHELFIIAKIWYFFTILTWIYCFVYTPKFIIFPIVVMFFMLFISAGFSILAIYRDDTRKQKIKRIILAILRVIRRQIIRYCIFCYIMPEKFPEVFE